MSRNDAIALSRRMAGLEPTVIRDKARPKWDRYAVEYSACYHEPSDGSLDSVRFRIWDIRTQAPSLVLPPQPPKPTKLDKKGGDDNGEVQQG